MSDFQDFIESIFHDIRTEDSVKNTRYKYKTPDKWVSMISDAIENLNSRGYEATSSEVYIQIDWSELAAQKTEE